MPPKTAIHRKKLAEKEEELKRLEERLRLVELSQDDRQSVLADTSDNEEVETKPQQKMRCISQSEIALVGKFSGYGTTTNFLEWSEKLALVMEDNNMTDNEKKRTIPLLLAGGAYTTVTIAHCPVLRSHPLSA